MMRSCDNIKSKNTSRYGKRKPFTTSVPLKKSKSETKCIENGECEIRNMLNDLNSCCSSSSQQPNKKIVIKLPLYIINSHPISKSPENDVSKKYDIQLMTPENENLYVSNHYVLLQVVAQYIYYKRLCIWIKDELKKKRSELLDVARDILISARDQSMCELQNIREDALTEDEKRFLLQYAEESVSLDSQVSFKITKEHSIIETTGVQVSYKTGSKSTQYPLEARKPSKSHISSQYEKNLFLCDKCSPAMSKSLESKLTDNYSICDKENINKAETCYCKTREDESIGCCTIQ